MTRPLILVGGTVVFILLLAIPFSHSAFLTAHFTRVLIYAIFAMSLDLLVGYCGLVSLGHAAFFGVAAYATALLSAKAGIANVLIGLPTSVATAIAAAVIIGILTLRTSGIYFIMATLAFAQMLYFLVNDNDFFGGSDGVLSLTRFQAKIGDFASLDLGNPATRYYMVLTAAAGTLAGLVCLVRSPFGKVLQGIKSNETRMRALGYRVARYKLGCFVIGGGIAGLAGHLYVLLTSLADPSLLDWLNSAQVLMMVIIGGLGSLIGPVAGAFLFIELIDRTSELTEHWKLIIGAAVIAVTLFSRGGLVGLANAASVRLSDKSGSA